ncbi:protease modulator HflC [Nitrogeniibacter aestuarii]|uniref:protease modulator HflC n=1 Tax=Nitrogeniibacter aestuarii TaxID=2815343 RepID=UPI001D0F6E4A|nr:protease modulator HflC [Nitrogeniibacter aestuarii]
MRDRTPIILGVVLFALAVVSMSMFTVDKRQFAIVRQFGQIKKVIKEPGLNFKVPLIQNVTYFDRRILTMDTPEPERFITSEKKNVLVDLFVKWRVADPELYFVSVGGIESRALTRIEQTVNAGLREEFGKRTVHEVVSGQRDDIMERMRVKADTDARKIGVEIVDVRLKRVDLPTEVSESVYRRMEAERKRVANELRSEGAAEAERIRADADRQREIIVAEAYRDAQSVKGEGDAKAAAIYADAFGQDSEFYSFYRSLQAYRETFSDKGDVLVVEPDGDFFKYLRQGSGRTKPKAE